MAVQETNFFEIILRETMIGKTIYDDEGTSILIDSLNYRPDIRCVFISDASGNKFKLKITDNFDFDYNQIDLIVPNKPRIKGKKGRK